MRKLYNNPMKSIKMKFAILTSSAVIVSAISTGIMGLIFSENILENESTRNIELYSDNTAQKINSQILEIEGICNSLGNVSYGLLPEDLDSMRENQEVLDEYVEAMKAQSIAIVGNNLEDCIMYLRFNPELFGPLDGFYIQRQQAGMDFSNIPMTDFSEYDRSETAHVGWYYIPVDRGTPTWMVQYRNPSTGKKLLSYVIPIYKDGYTIGIMGMDLNIDNLATIIDDIKVYDTGFAVILDSNKTIICHSKYEVDISEDVDKLTENVINDIDVKSKQLYEYSYGNKNYKIKCQELDNGMVFVMVAPKNEIYKELAELPMNLIPIIVVIGLIVIVLSLSFTNKITKPLRELTLVADRIAKGDYNTPIDVNGEDEVAQLASALRKTSSELNKYDIHMKSIAYRDGLTNLKNKSAYNDYVNTCIELMKDHNNKLTVVVMDVNNLKSANDNYGHEVGDLLILDVVNLIKLVFGDDASFRIGGDEFVAFLHDEDSDHAQTFTKRFKDEIKLFNQNEHKYGELSVAIGTATYHEKDTYEDVFARADAKMYKNKKKQKAEKSKV